jgi:hypothetical protein
LVSRRRWVVRSKIGQSLGWTARSEDVPLRQLVAVAVDVGKSSAVVQACDFSGRTLLAPCEFALSRQGVLGVVARLRLRCRAMRGWFGSGWKPPGTITCR